MFLGSMSASSPNRMGGYQSGSDKSETSSGNESEDTDDNTGISGPNISFKGGP
jgi:hypothetical protein